jgi:hypothetical protein
MDLISFTDFVLAWDHRSTPAAIKYFFPIMDLQKKVCWWGQADRSTTECLVI